MKTRELRELTVEDLIQKEKLFKKEIFNLTFQKEFGRVEKPGRFKQLRKSIAQIQTILKERERQDDGK